MPQIFSGARVFDGTGMHEGMALVVAEGRVQAMVPEKSAPSGQRVVLSGGILAPGLIDLQVNGGGGIMLDGAANVARIAAICAAHLRLGATGLLPTLISDTPEATARVIAAGVAAAKAKVPGFLGLHLEGPHLAPARCGAHDAGLIRPMTSEDLSLLCDAAAHLPSLMITLAPEAVRPDQITALVRAGAVVSLGHSDTTLAEARAAFAAGAKCVTHIFNAMSPLGHREPGLVGAALDSDVFTGLIADGVHVLAPVIRIALAAKRPETVFLVSDAMAPAGTDLTEFTLGTRRILRGSGRLTLENGTLAGADLSLPKAIRFMVRDVGVGMAPALAMATSVPAACIGRQDSVGYLKPGRAADMVHLTDDLALSAVWRAGDRV